MLIAEELLLLALDDETGRPRISTDQLDPALGGAVLAELALRERVGVTPPTGRWSERGRGPRRADGAGLHPGDLVAGG